MKKFIIASALAFFLSISATVISAGDGDGHEAGKCKSAPACPQGSNISSSSSSGSNQTTNLLVDLILLIIN